MEFVTADDFYKHAHQVIFKTMVELNDADEAIDALTVNNALESTTSLKMRAALRTLPN